MKGKVVDSNGEAMSQMETGWYRWESVNWRKLEHSNYKLQRRIYQASANGDVRKTHNLQRLLIKSKGAKLLAVRKVAQKNNGKKTAGIDGVKSLNPTQRLMLANDLNLSGKSSPVRRVWIPKTGKNQRRPLGIPIISDRAKQALVKLALEPEWEAKFEANSYGFRPGRSCQDAIEAIFLSIHKSNNYALDADIKGCFDNIDHLKLLKKLNTFPKLYCVIKGWLKAGIMEGDVFVRPKRGTPQGGVISPLMANIALHGIEMDTKNALKRDLFQHLKERYNRKDMGRALTMLRIIRYADDFVVMHESRDIIDKAKKYIENWLKNIGLQLNVEKTRIVHTLRTIDKTQPGSISWGLRLDSFM